MKKKIISDISANSLQVIINQLSGVLIFYFFSKFLDKKSFGEINWTIAVLITIFNILGSGIDQITVRKIAAGQSTGLVMRLYMLHVLFAGLAFYIFLLAGSLLFKDFFSAHPLLTVLGVAQFFLFLSMPFKQIAVGREQFRILLYMSTCANIIKVVGVPLLVISNRLSVTLVVAVFITGATMELILCIFLSRHLFKSFGEIPFNRKNYTSLIKESLPQLGSIIFNAAVARFDWILLGIISTAAILAEYSFAYRVFEVSTLPLLVLGPMLLPRFTRLYSSGPEPDLKGGKGELLVLLRVEMFIACLIALLLNILWEPFIDKITGGKYGHVNIFNIFMLSACMPFYYITNFLWTMSFARGRLKEVFVVTTITFLVNVTGDILLIPFFHGEGAAMAFLIATAIQTVLYISRARIGHIHKGWQSLVLCGGSAFLSGWLGRHFFTDVFIRTGLSTCLYFFLLLAIGQLRLNDWRILKSTLGI